MNTHKYDNVDFLGKKFGRLTVIEKAKDGRTKWVCKCACGNTIVLPAFLLIRYRSCGCLEKENKETLGKRNTTHGMAKSILYHKYTGMKDRCYNVNAKNYKHYGGRGIEVCSEWLKSFESFRDWAYKSGYDEQKKGYEQTLDRINVDGDYCPDNCRWINQKEQSNNRTNTIYLEYQGKKYTISEISEKYNIPYYFIRRYYKMGKDIDFIKALWRSKERIRK